MRTGVGLYIGTERICVVEAAKKGDKYEIVSSTEIDWSGGTSEASLKADLSKHIAEAFEKAKIKLTAPVMSGLSFNAVAARYFEMPLFPKGERDAAIRYEAQKYVSFGNEELCATYDASIDKAARRMKIMFLAAKKTTVDGHAEIIRSSGIVNVTPKPAFYLFGRLVARSADLNPKEIHLILDLNDDGTMMLSVFKGEIMLLTRSCSIMRDGSPNLEALMGELHLTFNFFARTYSKEGPISSVILTPNYQGDFAPWEALIKTDFDLPCRTVYPGAVFGFPSKVMSPEMGLATALALNGVEAPAEYRLKQSELKPVSAAANADAIREKTKKTALFALAAAFVLIGITHMVLDGMIRSGRSRLPSTLTLEELKNKERDLIAQRDSFAHLAGKRIYLTDKMNGLARRALEEARFTRLDFEDFQGPSGQSVISMKLEWEAPGVSPEAALSGANRFINTLKRDERFMGGFNEVKMSVLKSGEGSRFSAVFAPREARRESL